MMSENRLDSRPPAQQLDHLVFELLDPIHRLDDGSRQRLLEAARHFQLEPGERLATAAADLTLYLVQGRIERWRPGTSPEIVHELHPGSAEPLIPDGLSAADQAGTRIKSLDHR